MKKPVIAVDGYSSTGKSSISKEIANRLGLLHLDTGALYRGVTYFGLSHFRKGENGIDLPQLFTALPKLTLEFRPVKNQLQLYMNGQNVNTEIRSNSVSGLVSLIAAQKEVRDYLMETQRTIASEGGVILDGRDIGTVVFPDADFKFFLTASIEERTRRRFRELEQLGIPVPLDEVRQNLISRDKFDSEREIAPLKKAEDAILIDNSILSKEETIALILSYIKKDHATA